MQYIWKLFKWNNGTDRTELTQYMQIPLFMEPRLNGQLKTGEVILDTPTNAYPDAFPPKTKFTIEKWSDSGLIDYYDYCVDHDDVERYSGLPEVCCHRIHLIDPAVFAQGLHVDNIALTYELNDVTLKYKTVVPSDEIAIVSSRESIGSGHQRPNWSYGGQLYVPGSSPAWYNPSYGDSTHYYTNSYQYRWTGLSALNGLLYNLNGLTPHEIAFNMPILECYYNNGSAIAKKIFDCPTRCRVIRVTLKNGNAVAGTAVTVVNKLYNNPASVQNSIATEQGENIRAAYNTGSLAGLCSTFTGSYEDSVAGDTQQYAIKVFSESQITHLPAIINMTNTSISRAISFTTDVLTSGEIAEGYSYQYTISLQIEPYQSGALYSEYTIKAVVSFEEAPWWNWTKAGDAYWNISMSSYSTPSASSISASVSFLCRNMAEDADYTPPFLLKGRKYNCFDLLRRALLTTDTRIIDNTDYGLDPKYDAEGNDVGIQYPIAIDNDLAEKLKQTVMYESIFQEKNLWEVLQQIGYYLHAVPRLEFARNGKEQLLLKYMQLGGSTEKNNDSRKLTIFNSQTLDNFFTQYDSYVTNLFSPQNEVDEWITCKTSSSDYLIYNETAELHTKYNITEIIKFDIIKSGVPADALEYIFEKSVYDTLTSKTDYTPAKWCALYYQLGTSKILGLSYVPPSVNNDAYMALKTIVGKLFDNGENDANLKFNDLKLHIRYRTQDALRITQLRPDLENFMRTSEYEKYPHHEQFYGAQEKIIDSERLSANLFGQLIRVANGVYQCQEYAAPGQEKIPGDFVEIYGGNYYVTECENEYYPDAIFQKVTYSKNFNQLSQVVTIPSEPRFYEVSERSMIRREVRLLDFIKVSTQDATPSAPRFINSGKWHTFIRNLLFCDNGNAELPNFAYTNFKGDAWREHYNLPNNDISTMFPASETETNEGIYQPKPSASHTAVIVPALCFPMSNALVVEWDMDDNFKAGDCADTSTAGELSPGDSNTAYYALQPVRYCDVYGRADLFDFKLFYKTDWTPAQMQRLPFAEAASGDFVPTNAQSTVLVPESLSVGLDKDNREALSFNYQLNLLHRAENGEDFVVFPNLLGKKVARLKCALLRNTVSVFSDTVDFSANNILALEGVYMLTNSANKITVSFPPYAIDRSALQSIVLYDEENGIKYAYLAKNVAKLPDADKLQNWYIYPVYND